MMKFKRRGMIKINSPATRAMIGEICALVMTIGVVSGRCWGSVESPQDFSRCGGCGIGDAWLFKEFPALPKIAAWHRKPTRNDGQSAELTKIAPVGPGAISCRRRTSCATGFL